MKVTVCCMIKDTPEYLFRAFVEHYFHLGVSDIHFIVDKDSRNVEYIKSAKISYHYTKDIDSRFLAGYWDNKFIGRQTCLYNWFLNKYRYKYDWIMFVDDDEHVIMDLSELNKYSDKHAVYLPWKMLVRDELYQASEMSLSEYHPMKFMPWMINYVKDCSWKSIVNTRLSGYLKTNHMGDEEGVTLDGYTLQYLKDQGRFQITTETKLLTEKDYKNIYNDTFSLQTGYINHFYIRSFEEWVNRVFDRGDLWNEYSDAIKMYIPNRQLIEYFDNMDVVNVYLDDVYEMLNNINRKDIIDIIKTDPLVFAYDIGLTKQNVDDYKNTDLYKWRKQYETMIGFPGLMNKYFDLHQDGGMRRQLELQDLAERGII